MSINATNWVWTLNELPNATIKLVLMKHADHAHDDGTHTWQSTETVAAYALCSERTAQRANVWAMERGYIREGDQSVIPDHYDPRTRPVAYELAMNETTRRQWEIAHAAGANTLYEAARSAGQKGAAQRAANKAAKDAQVSGGDNLSPPNVASTPGVSTGDNLSPQDPGFGGDNRVTSGVTDPPSGGDMGVTQTTQETTPKQTTPSSAASGRSALEPEDASPTGSATKRGTRLPADFSVNPAMVQWARTDAPDVDGRIETQKFMDYWAAKPGKDGLKLDWIATWRNWFRSAQQRIDQQQTSRGTSYDGEKVWGPRPGAPAATDPASQAAEPAMSDEELERYYGVGADQPATESGQDVG